MLLAAAVAKASHDKVNVSIKHFAHLQGGTVDTGHAAVVDACILDHEPVIVAHSPGIGVLAALQLGANGGEVHGVLDDLEVVGDAESNRVDRDAEGLGLWHTENAVQQGDEQGHQLLSREAARARWTLLLRLGSRAGDAENASGDGSKVNLLRVGVGEDNIFYLLGHGSHLTLFGRALFW